MSDRGVTSQQTVRRTSGGRRPVVRSAPRQGDRFPRTQRRGEVHDDAHDRRAGRPVRRLGDGLRAALHPARQPAVYGRRVAGRPGRPRRQKRLRPSALARSHPRSATTARARGAGTRRARRGLPQAGAGLLPGHVTAPGHRGGAPRRSGGAALRRTRQRAGSRRDRVDPRPDAGTGGAGPHGAGLQPLDVRDGAHRRRPRRDRQGQAHLVLHRRRVHRAQLPDGGAGDHPG